MQSRAKFVFGGAVIVGAVTYLVLSGMSSTTAYYLSVSEAARYVRAHEGEAVKVKGQILAGSVTWQAKELRLSFGLTDNQQQIPVVYHGIIPDLFAAGREVIVEGRLTPAGLAANTILASCPSKYEPDVAAAGYKAP